MGSSECEDYLIGIPLVDVTKDGDRNPGRRPSFNIGVYVILQEWGHIERHAFYRAILS